MSELTWNLNLRVWVVENTCEMLLPSFIATCRVIICVNLVILLQILLLNLILLESEGTTSYMYVLQAINLMYRISVTEVTIVEVNFSVVGCSCFTFSLENFYFVMFITSSSYLSPFCLSLLEFKGYNNLGI